MATTMVMLAAGMVTVAAVERCKLKILVLEVPPFSENPRKIKQSIKINTIKLRFK